MHAFTEMTRAIREGKGKSGLVLCNGGVLSYQHVVVLSREPRKRGSYPEKNPLPAQLDTKSPEVALGAEGEAIVEVSLPRYIAEG